MACSWTAGPNSAPAIVNLIYLPTAFLSGLWVPIQVLPEILQRVAVAHGAERDLDRAGVVESVPPDGVAKAKRLERPHLHRVAGLQLDVTVERGVLARVGAGPRFSDELFGDLSVDGVDRIRGWCAHVVRSLPR